MCLEFPKEFGDIEIDILFYAVNCYDRQHIIRFAIYWHQCLRLAISTMVARKSLFPKRGFYTRCKEQCLCTNYQKTDDIGKVFGYPCVSNLNNQRACREHKALIINQILKRYLICNFR